MYKNALDILNSEETSLVEMVIQKEFELFEKSRQTTLSQTKDILTVMRDSSQDAIERPNDYKGHLIGGDAYKMNTFKNSYSGDLMTKAMARAFSSSEVNASMGKICAAPTAGSCGIIPAALMTAEECLNLQESDMIDGLLVSSMIGELITMNATVSGAVGGCQAECGSAAAMAAGMLVFLKKGSKEEVFNAAAIALKNVMGLVCDPIAGLVEAPCAKRNASGVINAIISADMSLAGVQSIVPFDEVVIAMFKVGKSLPSSLKETALGGIARTPTAIELQKKIFET